jgi:hypothetical protein
MVNPKTTLFFGITAFAFGIVVTTSVLWPRTQKAEARLEAMRTAISDGSYPHPIGCSRFQGAPWEGFVSLGDTWPKDEPKPQVCHLKTEVERLGLVPKGQI